MKSLTRKERLALIEWNVSRIVAPLGYRAIEEIPYGRPDKAWWFSRKGDHFETEAVCVGVEWRPARILTVDLFGSSQSESYLRAQGVVGETAVGTNLFNYQFDFLGRDPASLLKPAIPLGEPKDYRGLFDRLAQEIVSIHPLVWKDLWNIWRKSA